MFGVPLWVVLGALAALACVFGDPRQIRAACALFFNWMVLTDYYELTGNQYDVPVNMAVDWLTVVFGVCSVDWLLLHERRRVWIYPETAGQAAIAASFGLGMVFHADWLIKEALGGDPSSRAMQYPYWWRFHDLAWAQALLFAGWMGDGWRRSILRVLRDRRRLLALSHGSSLAGEIPMRGCKQ